MDGIDRAFGQFVDALRTLGFLDSIQCPVVDGDHQLVDVRRGTGERLAQLGGDADVVGIGTGALAIPAACAAHDSSSSWRGGRSPGVCPVVTWTSRRHIFSSARHQRQNRPVAGARFDRASPEPHRLPRRNGHRRTDICDREPVWAPVLTARNGSPVSCSFSDASDSTNPTRSSSTRIV